MLQLESISITLGVQNVLRDVSLQVEAGEMVALMGRSGIGKTSLLRAAAGLLQVEQGRVLVDGRRAMVFQEPRLLDWRSAVDNAALGLKAQGMTRRERQDRAEALLLELGFQAHDLSKRPDALSGGMRQRVAIARALAIEPALLLLDEPFAALDPGLRRELQYTLRQAVTRRGVSALLATHDLVEAVRLGGRLVLLAGQPATILIDRKMANLSSELTDAAIFDVCAMLLRSHDFAAGLGLSDPRA